MLGNERQISTLLPLSHSGRCSLNKIGRGLWESLKDNHLRSRGLAQRKCSLTASPLTFLLLSPIQKTFIASFFLSVICWWLWWGTSDHCSKAIYGGRVNISKTDALSHERMYKHRSPLAEEGSNLLPSWRRGCLSNGLKVE